jgi:hypothetical protein
MSAIPSPQGQTGSPLRDPAKGHLQVPGKAPYSSDPPSNGGSDVSLHRIKNLPGYTTPVFKGKEEQRAKVQENVAAKVRVSVIQYPNYRTKSFVTRGSSLGSSSHTRSNGSTLTSESMTPTSETSRLRSSRIISLASLERKYSHIQSMTRPSWSSTSRGSTTRETAPRLSTPVRRV